MRRRIRSRRRALALLLGVLAPAAIASAACSEPGYRYYTSATNEVVVKLPSGWTQVKAGVPVDDTTGRPEAAGTWVAMYDAASSPSQSHVQSLHAVDPAVYLLSAPVSKETASTITDDVLRDQLLPVTPARRAQAVLEGFPGTRFAMLSDTSVNTRTARGVHVVVTYDTGQGPEIYDKLVVTDPRRTRVHVLLVHCTKTCYESHRAAIDETMRSFTVRLAP